jgi:hypothetical protein
MWAVSGAWRGSRGLFRQLVRKIANLAEGPPVLDGNVRGENGTWEEEFHTPEEFDALVPDEMVRRFEWISIRAGAEAELHIDLRLQQRQFPRRHWEGHKMPRAGAILMVTGTSPEKVENARRALVAALKQGALWRPGGISVGSGRCPDAPRQKLLSRGLVSDIGDMVAAFLLPLAVAAAIVTLGYQQCQGDDCNPLTVDLSSAAWPWIAGVLIGLTLARVRWYHPQLNPLLKVIAPVEIADTSRARKAAAYAWKLVGYVVSPGAIALFIVGRLVNAS